MFDGDRAARAPRPASPTPWRSRAGKSPSRRLPHTRWAWKAAWAPHYGLSTCHARAAAGRTDNRW